MTEIGDGHISKGEYTFPWQDIPDGCLDNICYLIIPNGQSNTISISNTESTQTQEMFNSGSVLSFYTDKAENEEQIMVAGSIHTGFTTIWSVDKIVIIERTYEGRRQFAMKIYTRFDTPNEFEPKADTTSANMEFIVASRPFCLYNDKKYSPMRNDNSVSCRYYANFLIRDETPKTQKTPKMKYKISNAVIFLKTAENNI